MKYEVKLVQWWDVITTDGADAPGQDEKIWAYNSLIEAAKHYAELIQSGGYYDKSSDNFASEVLYFADPVIYYDDGEQFFERLAVVGLSHMTREGRIFNKLVERYLAA